MYLALELESEESNFVKFYILTSYFARSYTKYVLQTHRVGFSYETDGFHVHVECTCKMCMCVWRYI